MFYVVLYCLKKSRDWCIPYYYILCFLIFISLHIGNQEELMKYRVRRLEYIFCFFHLNSEWHKMTLLQGHKYFNRYFY